MILGSQCAVIISRLLLQTPFLRYGMMMSDESFCILLTNPPKALGTQAPYNVCSVEFLVAIRNLFPYGMKIARPSTDRPTVTAIIARKGTIKPSFATISFQ